MVFFTCNHCGESLKKGAVEKHYQFKSCRNAPIFLTCVDCLKDFRDQEYVEHTKCISELERYSAKGFVAKPDKNKGAQKQEIWTDCIQELAERRDLDRNTKNVLQRIASQANVPRKKPKFVNFLKSSMRFSAVQAEKVWTIIEEGLEEFKKKSAPPTQPQIPTEQKPDESDQQASVSDEKAIESTTDNANATNVVSFSKIVEHALAQPGVEKSTKKALKKLQKAENVPLDVSKPKKKSFLSYLNEQHGFNQETSVAVWKSVSQSVKTLVTGAGGESSESVKRSYPDEADEPQSKKPKTEEADSTTDANGESTFDWNKHILRIFNKNQDDNKLGFDSLRSKVIKKFLKSVGENDSLASQYEKTFKKNLKKVTELKLQAGVVQLKA